MGQPADDVDADLHTIQMEFVEDAEGMVCRAKDKLMSAGLSHRDGALLLELLVQLVEADETVQANESRYIRNLVRDVGLDRVALRKEHPEWRSYLAEGIRTVEGDAWPFADALASLLDTTSNPSSE